VSRYRPPAPRSSPYITRAGFARLQAEQKTLWTRRAEVTEALAAAAAEGDRSENAEYIYRKKELRELDRRIRYLQKRLPDLLIVERRADSSQVFFGATVQLLDDEDGERSVTLVGADEIDLAKGQISVDAPLAKALLKRGVDDEVVVTVEGVQTHYTICSISYAGEPNDDTT